MHLPKNDVIVFGIYVFLSKVFKRSMKVKITVCFKINVFNSIDFKNNSIILY